MQTNHARYSAMLLISALAVGHCAQAKTFTNSKGYQVSTPSNWITKRGPSDSKYASVFYCATNRKGLPALPMVEIATRPQEAMTMQKLASLGPYMVRGTFHDFHQTSAEYTSIGHVPALDIRGTYPRAGQTICVRELFALRAGEAYIITTAYPQAQESLYAPLTQIVIKSVRWRTDKP